MTKGELNSRMQSRGDALLDIINATKSLSSILCPLRVNIFKTSKPLMNSQIF